MYLVKCNNEKDIYLRMNEIRGMMALVVLFSHIWAYSDLLILIPFNKMVTIAVTYFFFLSGYSLTRSFTNDETYLNKIRKVKIPFLVILSVNTYILGVLLEFVQRGSVNYYLPINLYHLFSTTNWYVYELLAFYIIFFLCAKHLKKYTMVFFILILSVIAFCVLFFERIVEASYNSIIGFSLGMIFYIFDFYRVLIKRKILWIWSAVIVCISFGLMFIVDHESFFFAGVRNFAACGSICLIFICLYYIKINNGFVKYINRLSTELYFYHIPILLVLRTYIKNNIEYCIVAVLLTFLVSELYRLIDGRIRRCLEK